MSQVLICDHYEIRLDALLAGLKHLNPRRILVHAPNGLKHLYACIEEALKSSSLEGMYFSTSPGYGACDIPLEEAITVKADVIVHLGHERYSLPNAYGDQNVEVLYVPVFYRRQVSEDLLKNLYDVLEGFNAKKVTISSTLIETQIKEQVFEYLVQRGVLSYSVKIPILGCLYDHVISLDNAVDAHVVVAGGVFHALGLGLLAAKPVIALDPYLNKVWIASTEASKVLKRRLYTVLKAKETLGNRVGLVIGARPGQHRPTLVSNIEKLALSKGYKIYRILSSYLTIERLIAIDNALNLDFYVITSCPRLPIDDLSEFYKPVLTPGEFIMLATGCERYIYPW